jgi:GNAT superfamily N-acetyltransferase
MFCRFAANLGLHVREATIADASGLREAHLRFSMEMQVWDRGSDPERDGVPDSLTSGIRELIEAEGGERILLLTRELPDCRTSTIVGFVYSYDDTVRGGTSCYIAQVYVEPSERGRGLGEVLVCAALAAAHRRATDAAHLYVCSRNTAACRLYSKLGFQDGGVSDDTVHDRMMRIPSIEGNPLPEQALAGRELQRQESGRLRSTRSRDSSTARSRGPSETNAPTARDTRTTCAKSPISIFNEDSENTARPSTRSRSRPHRPLLAQAKAPANAQESEPRQKRANAEGVTVAPRALKERRLSVATADQARTIPPPPPVLRQRSPMARPPVFSLSGFGVSSVQVLHAACIVW